ncbi:MAG: hypothetical protein HYZ42_01865 [Bacteroidetes bacterium]|nr:hypothetical protein [Bacteroidota bacterium]
MKASKKLLAEINNIEKEKKVEQEHKNKGVEIRKESTITLYENLLTQVKMNVSNPTEVLSLYNLEYLDMKQKK